MAIPTIPKEAENAPMTTAVAALQYQPSLGMLQYLWHRATREDDVQALPPAFEAVLRSIDDETIVSIYGEAADAEESSRAPYRWAQNLIKNEVERRLVERRASRAPQNPRPWDLPQKMKIPHPTVTVENEVTLDSYKYDEDQIEEALRGLPDDEIDALLIRTPERQESIYGLSEVQLAAIRVALAALEGSAAESTLESLLETRTIPATVEVRNSSTLIAWCKANADTTREKIIAAATTRKATGVKTTIRPKKSIKRADPIVVAPVQPTVIEGAA